jgi:hypothetical protein
MRIITEPQKLAIMAIIGKHRLDKEELILAATNERTTSVRAMYFEEALQLLQKLNAKPKFDPREKMIRKIYSLAHEMRWVLPNKPTVVDVDYMNKRLIQYGYLKKPLHQYSYAELPKLLTQVEEMHTHYLTAK